VGKGKKVGKGRERARGREEKREGKGKKGSGKRILAIPILVCFQRHCSSLPCVDGAHKCLLAVVSRTLQPQSALHTQKQCSALSQIHTECTETVLWSDSVNTAFVTVFLLPHSVHLKHFLAFLCPV